MRRMLAVVATGLALLAVACGDADPRLEAAAAEYPTGPGDIVVRVSSGGGFVPLEVNLAHVPQYTLYGDGRLIWVDGDGGSFPSPALPALRTTLLGDEQIGALLDHAARAGIGDDIDYGIPNITDVGGTSVAVNVDGGLHTSSAYALGFEDESLTDEQIDARERLEDFIDDVRDAAEPSPVAYEGAAVSVFVLEYGPSDGGDDDALAIDWPFAELGPIPGSGTARTPCFTLAGDEAAQAVKLAEGADSATSWVFNGEPYHLVFRPLLPDESGCDDLG